MVQFEGVNRHARFNEVMCSFMHIMDACRDEDLNDTMDNIITLALSSRPIAIILCTILGKNTFCRLLHVNRDIADNAKLLTHMTHKIDMDELLIIKLLHCNINLYA